MKLERKIIFTIIFIVAIMLIIGFSYAKFIKIDVQGNNNYNVVMGNTISGSELVPNFVVTYDEGSNIIDTSYKGEAYSRLIKIKVSTAYNDSQTISIKLDTVINDIYNKGTYNLYSCNQTNYNNATLANVDSICTVISSTSNHYLPNYNEIRYLSNDPSLTLNAKGTNYYVLTILTETTSYYKRYKGIIDVVSYTPQTNENLLVNKIQAAYPPVADNIASVYVTSGTGINFSQVASTTNGQGLYINSKSNIASDPTQGTIKYFRGTINNYVSFAGMVWRVVRINSDNSVRIITNTTPITNKPFNNTNTEKYAGYTYDDSNVSTNDGTNSNAKTQLDSWYTSNLSAYASYIVQNASFCNDTTTINTQIHYSGYGRIFSNKTPTFSCPITDKLYGGEYFLNIATITADEALYAGAVFNLSSTSYEHYLKNSTSFWTLTPFQSTSSTSNIYVFSSGNSNYQTVTQSYSIRPVVNLKADTLVIGSGTSGDPWVVQ